MSGCTALENGDAKQDRVEISRPASSPLLCAAHDDCAENDFCVAGRCLPNSLTYGAVVTTTPRMYAGKSPTFHVIGNHQTSADQTKPGLYHSVNNLDDLESVLEGSEYPVWNSSMFPNALSEALVNDHGVDLSHKLYRDSSPLDEQLDPSGPDRSPWYLVQKIQEFLYPDPNKKPVFRVTDAESRLDAWSDKWKSETVGINVDRASLHDVASITELKIAVSSKEEKNNLIGLDVVQVDDMLLNAVFKGYVVLEVDKTLTSESARRVKKGNHLAAVFSYDFSLENSDLVWLQTDAGEEITTNLQLVFFVFFDPEAEESGAPETSTASVGETDNFGISRHKVDVTTQYTPGRAPRIVTSLQNVPTNKAGLQKLENDDRETIDQGAIALTLVPLSRSHVRVDYRFTGELKDKDSNTLLLENQSYVYENRSLMKDGIREMLEDLKQRIFNTGRYQEKTIGDVIDAVAKHWAGLGEPFNAIKEQRIKPTK